MNVSTYVHVTYCTIRLYLCLIPDFISSFDKYILICIYLTYTIFELIYMILILSILIIFYLEGLSIVMSEVWGTWIFF